MVKLMNIVSAVSWTDIQTEVLITSTICDQDSVRICSLDVKMNNTDCAADFSLLNLPKGKSLGRSKPATNS